MTMWDRALTVGLLMAAVLSFFVMPGLVGSGHSPDVAEVAAGGRATRLIPLNKSASIYIKGNGGGCRLEVKAGRIRVVESDCPDRLCMGQGWISGAGRTIVCLPHRIIVTIGSSGAQTVDAVVR